MWQVVDFKNEEQITNFIKIFRTQLFDQTTSGSYNIAIKKASFSGFLTIANILKSYDNVYSFIII